jgi:hypothetical protein
MAPSGANANVVGMLARRPRPPARLTSLLALGAALLLGAVLAGVAPGSRAQRGASVRATGAAGLKARAARRAAAGTLYWGAWIGSQFTGTEAPWDMHAVTKFQSLVGGKGLSLIEFSSPFEDCYVSPCTSYSFPTQAFTAVRRYGAIPLFAWGSNAIPVVSTAPRFSLRKIVGGDYDSYIRSWAKAAAAWGHPFFLRFDWEMNGRWFPWGWGANGNAPGEFILAWRHVHQIFTSVGATNANWVWCPNVDPSGVFGPLQALYPGNAYVNWTCVDLYNRDAPWTGFDGLFRSTYSAITELAPAKPMLIAEIGSGERGGSKATWITDALTNLSRRYPLVRGLAWFEKSSAGFDWTIESSKAATRAFVRAISSPVYAGSRFAALPDGPIRPPG